MVIMTVGMALTSQAAKWRVNNYPGVDADFTDVQAAHDNASPGDTLYIEGSIIDYGFLGLSKQLVVLGPGYFLTENDSTQANKADARVQYVNFTAGSDGSQICGLHLYDVANSNYSIVIDAGVSNITIRSCLVTTYYYGCIYLYGGNDHITIEQCYFLCTVNHIIYLMGQVTNLVVQNNIFYGNPSYYYFYVASTNYMGSGLIYNNVFYYSGYLYVENSIFRNNIYDGNYFYPLNSIYTNNIGTTTVFGTENGNQSNVDMNAVFLCYYPCTPDVHDGRFRLASGSPAINAGYGGEDCGAYDGPAPYRLSGLNGIPAVWYFHVTGTNADVKVKSH